MTIIRRPRSIRGRYTAATSLLVLIILAGLSVSVCHVLGSGTRTQAGQATGPAVPGLPGGYGLECLMALLVLILTTGTGAATWWLLGRALRPIQAVRAHLDKVTVNDLGRRMPVPPGDDEIAEPARTANHTLARLDEAVARQRGFVATTSRELRNPITGLRAELEDALDHPEDTDFHHTLRTALTIADRLDTIINGLLSQARTEAARGTSSPASPRSSPGKASAGASSNASPTPTTPVASVAATSAITRDAAHRHRGGLALEDSPAGARLVPRTPRPGPPAASPPRTGTPRHHAEAVRGEPGGPPGGR
ncbi:histidine kinase dimerization/phospho-acceptor domain-containing protein [Streptosporangium sp. NPDC023963]|uniref:sensor histidine kinase n=1 Tax=Streptosporangium sp. NPDC023963 TaxID=3155608 RepID=UPI00341E5C13